MCQQFYLKPQFLVFWKEFILAHTVPGKESVFDNLLYDKNVGFLFQNKICVPKSSLSKFELKTNRLLSNKNLLHMTKRYKDVMGASLDTVLSAKPYSTNSFTQLPGGTYTFYSDIKLFFLNNPPLNEDTQIELEKYILSKGISLKESQSEKSVFKYNLFSQYSREFIVALAPNLKKHIERFLSLSTEYRELSDKNYQVYLMDIIDTIGVEKTIQYILGCYINILSIEETKIIEKNYITAIINDLGKSIFNEYYKNLYLKYKNENSNTDALFSDFREKNKDLFNLFNNNLLRMNIISQILQ